MATKDSVKKTVRDIRHKTQEICCERKEFLEAGKQRLTGNTQREVDSREVKELKSENEQLKQLVAELTLKNRVLTPALAGGAREKRLTDLEDL